MKPRKEKDEVGKQKDTACRWGGMRNGKNIKRHQLSELDRCGPWDTRAFLCRQRHAIRTLIPTIHTNTEREQKISSEYKKNTQVAHLLPSSPDKIVDFNHPLKPLPLPSRVWERREDSDAATLTRGSAGDAGALSFASREKTNLPAEQPHTSHATALKHTPNAIICDDTPHRRA